MKKLFLILAAAVAIGFASCSKDDNDKTTYDITNNMEVEQSSVPYLNGSLYEVVVFHYTNGNIVKQDNIKQINSGGGKCNKFEIDNSIDMLQVSFRFLPEESQMYNETFNRRKYVVAKTAISKGKHHPIVITSETMITTNSSK